MKITGYTILYTILTILLLYGLVCLEIYIYNKWWIGKSQDHFGVIFIHSIFLVGIIFVLGISGVLNNVDKFLKRTITHI